MIPCAYLRVYRPLDTFGEPERARWERFILSDRRRPRQLSYRQEVLGDGNIGYLTPIDVEQAEIRLVGGRYFVCPWETKLRVMASILSLREQSPADLADLLVPEAEARRAARELARIRRRHPTAVPTMLQSPWHVPVRWFLLVEDGDRRLVESPAGGHRLYYWSPIRQAKERAERAAHALRRSELEALAPLARELSQWLGSHHPSAIVELDYATLSGLFAWDELDDDHSALEIHQAILALSGAGGLTRAGELYQSVAARWADAKARVTLN
jgi:hypothetical protein